MGLYKVIAGWRIRHDFFDDKIGRGVELQMSPGSCVLLRRRGVFFRKLGEGEWVLLGTDDVVWDPADELVLNMKIGDCSLLYYTEDSGGGDEFCFSPFGAEQGKQMVIAMESRDFFWEYLLIARTGEEKLNLEIRETGERLLFGTPEKTEFMGRQVLRTVSAVRVGCREIYDYQLSLVERMSSGRRILIRSLPLPEPGRFVTEPDCIRQIVYY